MTPEKTGRHFIIDGALKPGGCYSHVVVANGLAFVLGQPPKDPETGLIPPAFADQIRLTLSNVRTILEGIGLGLEDVVKVNAYLSDVTRFAEYNAIYSEFFTNLPPARTTIGCWMPGILVEVDCIAALRS